MKIVQQQRPNYVVPNLKWLCQKLSEVDTVTQ